MKKILSTCVLIIITCCNTYAHDLLCKHWLRGTFKGKESALYPINGGFNRDTSLDSDGVVGQCHDGFPSWGERVKFERIGTNPFEAQYRVTKQYCWARFILDGSNNCGGPSVSRWFGPIPIQWTWEPPNYTSWGLTYDAQISASDLGAGCKTGVNVAWLHNYEICRYRPGVAMKHGGNNDSKNTKICAYYEAWWFSQIIGNKDYKTNLIGCVDEPIKPPPGTYNLVIPAGNEPYVDTSLTMQQLLDLGSRFNSPVAKVAYQHIDRQTGKTYDFELILRYKFNGDSIDLSLPNTTAPQCATFNNVSTTYCIAIPKDDQTKACVCAKDECDFQKFIGCVARPTPKDSNMAIIGEFASKHDYQGKDIPALKASLVKTLSDGSVIKKDADGAKVVERNGVYYKLDNNNSVTSTPAKDPVIIERFNLPQGNNAVAGEYYKFVKKDASGTHEMLMRDKVSMYGVDLYVVIPKLDNNKIKEIGIITPAQNQLFKQCFIFSSSDDKGVPKYFVPNGQRDKRLCCPDYVTNKERDCIVPPVKKKCDDGQDAKNDEEAQRAFCPGTYEGPEDPNVADEICLMCENKNIMPEPFCLKMPIDCGKQDIPNSFNSFATWDKSAPGTTSYSSCSIDYGLEDGNEISIYKKDVSSLPLPEQSKVESEHNKLLISLADLKDESKNLNRRISKMELPPVDPKYQSYFDIRDNARKPKRVCTANLYGVFSNPCLITNSGCVELKKPLALTGNMLLSDSQDKYKKDAQGDLEQLKPGQERMKEHKLNVVGKCPDGYKEDGSLTRQCITRYRVSKDPAGNGTITKISQFWGERSNGQCVKIN